MITLHELLGIREEDFNKFKVHFATGLPNRKEPYNAFLSSCFAFALLIAVVVFIFLSSII